MPNSILWIGLVVLWVFVLFPMLANRHPRIRRTTDAALATRVLHRGGSKRRRRNGPHDSDPDYRPTRRTRRLPHSDDAEDRMTTPADEPVTDDEHTVTRPPAEARAADAADAPEDRGDDAGIEDSEDDEPRPGDARDDHDGDREYPARGEDDREDDDADERDHADAEYDADADADERAPDDAGEREYAAAPDAPRRVAARIPPAPAKAPARLDDDLYAEDDDEPAEDGDEPVEDDRAGDRDGDDRTEDGRADDFVPTRRGRGGYDPEADAIARAARYTFRQRAVLGLMISGLLCGALGIVVSPVLWWGTGLSLVVLVTYLAYLRKQVRMEEEIRRRRSARLSRNRPRGADRADRDEDQGRRPRRAAVGMDRDTARTLRRRSVLLEPDDEAPDFEHLETFDPATARALRNRAAEMRRAAGE